jgi:hypothetical protein
LENDEACLEILSEYKHAYFIGDGGSGIVIGAAMDNGSDPIAIKLISRLSTTEIETSCQVDEKIAKDVPMFTRFYGWIVCSPPLPESWQHVINEKRNYDPEGVGYNPFRDNGYYLVFELGPAIKLKNFRFDSVMGMQSFLFELFFELWEAFKRTGFQHNDLHHENVLVYSQSYTNRNYTLNNSDRVVIRQLHYPKLIDYGNSTFNDSFSLDDAELLVEFVMLGYNADSEIYAWLNSLAKTIAGFPSMTYADLLNSEHFSSLFSTESVPKRLKPAQCRICNRMDATRCFEADASFLFCNNDACVRKMGPIGHLINSK